MSGSLKVRFDQPILLKSDNFTDLIRTPWAGNRIAGQFKDASLGIPKMRRVGEAWEFSCDPSMPSYVLGGQSLIDVIKSDPQAALSPTVCQQISVCPEILVKLLNAADPLSLQVHPYDDDSHLKAHECGKPESWYIVAAEPGAGLYLGFSKRVDAGQLRILLADGDRLRDLLQFVPVQPGDYFEIEPGVPHAIGSGVTLLEPQRIVAGKSGKTFRMWDWGRRYDEAGYPSEAGSPRELHIEEAMRLIDPQVQVGDTFVTSLKRSPKLQKAGENIAIKNYPANSHYQLSIVETTGSGGMRMVVNDGYAAAVLLQGSLELTSGEENLQTLVTGQTAFLPHRFLNAGCKVRFKDACRWALILPSCAHIEFSVL